MPGSEIITAKIKTIILVVVLNLSDEILASAAPVNKMDLLDRTCLFGAFYPLTLCPVPVFQQAGV
jgi:hypothetical protein